MVSKRIKYEFSAKVWQYSWLVEMSGWTFVSLPKEMVMEIGTGDSEWIISFYESCGFKISHKVDNFFIDNYDKPIFEDGKQLIDMIYLRKDL